MRRLWLASLTLLAMTPAAALAAEPAERPLLRAKLVACETGADPASRYAVFTGSMPALPGAVRMEMRFVLLQRHGGAGGVPGYARVPLPRWGQWEHTERRGIAGFIFTKRVEQLSAPATYRAVVRFRWLDAHGDVLRSARRTSATCRQGDPRPDLEVAALSASDDGRYVVDVVDDGPTDAEPFQLTLRFGGYVASVLAPAIPAGQHRTVAISAERCAPGDSVSVTLDSADDVDEGDELDNAVSLPCPFK